MLKLGLCNRLVMMDLALIIARRTGIRVVIGWSNSQHCPGDFHDLLEVPIVEGIPSVTRVASGRSVQFAGGFDPRRV